MTLYLHVGAHKTGTTTIQQFSSARRQLLREKGLSYPDLAEIGRPTAVSHHAFAHAIAGQAMKPPFLESEIEAFVELCADQSRAGNVLVSAEAIFRHVIGDGPFATTHAVYIEQLADRLGRVPDIVPVVVLRRQDTFAASMAQEHVKTMTLTRSPTQFVIDNVEFMDFEAHLKLYERNFRRPLVLVYEHLIAGDGLLRNFFRELGVTLSVEEAAFKPFNTSLHPAVVLYKSLVNAGAETAAGNAYLRQSLLVQVSDELFGDERRSLYSADELDGIFSSYQAANERLARHLGLPSGTALFPDREPPAPRYEALTDSDFHRIDARVAQLLAEIKAKRVGSRPGNARPKSPWRRLLTRLGLRRGLQ